MLGAPACTWGCAARGCSQLMWPPPKCWWPFGASEALPEPPPGGGEQRCPWGYPGEPGVFVVLGAVRWRGMVGESCGMK